MAARKVRTSLSDEWREKIRTSEIITVLQNHVSGKRKLATTQVQAARILLGKVLPDLVSTELTGKGGGPIRTHVDGELTRLLLPDLAAVRASQAAVETDAGPANGAAVRLDGVLGEAKPARTNGHG